MIREVDTTYSNPFARRIEYVINDKVIGYLDYSLIYDRMEIDNFCVLDEYRNQGIGTKLLAHLISIAISYRVINITLEVRVSNEIAINLYKKFGFREVALRKYYVDEGYILFSNRIIL